MRKPRIRLNAKRVTGQDIMVLAVGSSVMIWAGVLHHLLT